MPRTPIRRAALLAAVVALTLGSQSRSFGQGPFTGPGMLGLSAPRFEPGGGQWARVVTATPKWLVLENAAGQQFPVSFGAINVFVIRWPANALQAGAGTMAEVTGIDLMNGSVMAGHVDLFSGSALSLVTPTSTTIVGYNRVLRPTAMNPFSQNMFGRVSLMPGEEFMPRRRHVVGVLLGGNPIVIAPPGGQSAIVVPGAGGMSVTQVTIGSPTFVRPGDAVWYLPINATPQTLAIGRLVVHKTIPMAQFVP